MRQRGNPCKHDGAGGRWSHFPRDPNRIRPERKPLVDMFLPRQLDAGNTAMGDRAE